MIIPIDQGQPCLSQTPLVELLSTQESVPYETGVLAAIESVKPLTDGSEPSLY